MVWDPNLALDTEGLELGVESEINFIIDPLSCCYINNLNEQFTEGFPSVDVSFLFELLISYKVSSLICIFLFN